MRWFRKQPEARATAVQSQSDFVRVLGLQDFLGGSASAIDVTLDKAMGVPAIWSAVNFISGTIAGLPLHVYRRSPQGRERVSNGIATMLHDAVSPEMTSFAWRKFAFEQVLTVGRSYTLIERNRANRPINLWPLETGTITVQRRADRITYKQNLSGQVRTYEASEIIDLPFALHPNGLDHRAPIRSCRDAIALAIAATEYGSKFFQGGGVPPFAVTGNFQSAGALQRAADDLAAAVTKAAKDQRIALTLPAGLEIKPIGGDPEKSQLVELKRFTVEEIARIYAIPPTFLQDLTHGTYSNTEQQDLHFVKHTLKRWIEQAEQELNLKLFGRGSQFYAEFAVDGLLRGDFKTRMEGHAHAVQNGIATPNEVREVENRPALPGGDRLMIQGATVPLMAQTDSGDGQPTDEGADDDV